MFCVVLCSVVYGDGLLSRPDWEGPVAWDGSVAGYERSDFSFNLFVLIVTISSYCGNFFCLSYKNMLSWFRFGLLGIKYITTLIFIILMFSWMLCCCCLETVCILVNVSFVFVYVSFCILCTERKFSGRMLLVGEGIT